MGTTDSTESEDVRWQATQVLDRSGSRPEWPFSRIADDGYTWTNKHVVAEITQQAREGSLYCRDNSKSIEAGNGPGGYPHKES